MTTRKRKASRPDATQAALEQAARRCDEMAEIIAANLENFWDIKANTAKRCAKHIRAFAVRLQEAKP